MLGRGETEFVSHTTLVQVESFLGCLYSPDWITEVNPPRLPLFSVGQKLVHSVTAEFAPSC